MAGVGGRAGRAGRAARGGALCACTALLLAGCAAMPSSGEVRRVGNGQQADADTQVQVFGIPPHPGESAQEIVNGFLEATTSGEPDFDTAKKYLAADLKKRWNPLAGITVLASGPTSKADTDAGTDASSTQVAVAGVKAAQVDAGHAYTPAHGGFDINVGLVKQGNEWRISDLPPGLILSASDFQRIYHSANMYYFARLGSDEHRAGARQETLVADPVYLRQQQPDALAAALSALLEGPSSWLAPVVSSAAPPGTGLSAKAGKGVTLDDSQHLKVQLNKAADGLAGERCRRLAAQLFATAQGQASVKLASVDVLRADGSVACSLSSDDAFAYASVNVAGSAAGEYYIGSEQRQLMQLATGETTARPVPGPFGAAKAGLMSVAVRRDEQVAAAVKTDGRQLVVAPLSGGGIPRQVPLTSAAKDPRNGLSAPSWDGFGDLWVADRNPAVSRLYVLRDGAGQPVQVTVPELDGRIESLRVSSDGVRIALVVADNGADRLELGRIDRAGTPEAPQYSVQGLRDLTPTGESVVSVSWAGASRLVVLGSDQGGGQQFQYVNTDGSVAPALESIGEAVSVAASEDPTQPLLASYDGSVYWLPDDSNWKKVTPKGDSPVYPG
jgi:hypothetical protein